MNWWQSLVLSSAAMAINVAVSVVKNPASRQKLRGTLLAVWLAAKQIPLAYPDDPEFQ